MTTMHLTLTSTVSDQAYTGLLTTDHAASSYGIPVLILQEDGRSRGPHDVLPDGAEMTQASYSQESYDLGDLVVRPEGLTDEEWTMLERWMQAVESRGRA